LGDAIASRPVRLIWGPGDHSEGRHQGLLDMSADIRAFIAASEAKLKTKD